MKKTICAAALAALALAVPAAHASAQSLLPLHVEGRLDAGIPVGGSGDALETGVGFGINGSLNLTPMLAVYGGWSRFGFGVQDGGATGDDDEIHDDGWALGGKVIVGSGRVMPYGQAGVLFRGGDNGWEAGGGVIIPLVSGLSLTPSAVYRKVGELKYVALGAGARVHL
jgi:hypothetical protein